MSKSNLCSRLYKAADDGDEEAVRALLEEGADPNDESARGGFVGSWPLHVAATACSLECVELLLKAGANPMSVTSSEGWTALHNAVWRNEYDIVHRLLEVAPALCFVKGKKKGHRAVDVAREKKFLDIVELLDDTQREYLKIHGTPPKFRKTTRKRAPRGASKKKSFAAIPFLRKARDRLFSKGRDSSKSSDRSETEVAVPDRWTVRVRRGGKCPHLPRPLRDAGKDLKSLLEKKGSCTEDDRPYKTLKRLFASPCAVVSQDSEGDRHVESDDQIFKDLAREAIVLNGSLFESHIALKAGAALGKLRTALREAFKEAEWRSHTIDDAVAFTLQACTRTTHGGISHDVVNAIINSDAFQDSDYDAGAIDSTIEALDSALASGDITKEEYAAIRSKTESGAGMFGAPTKKVREAVVQATLMPITPSHCADEALTQVVVRRGSVLVLASSAFDVGVPSKVVVQTTMEIVLAIDTTNDGETTKFNEEPKWKTTTRRLLRLNLWKSGEDVAKALSKRGGADSKSFGALMHSSLTTASAESDREIAQRREDSLSVTPLLDAARHLNAKVNERAQVTLQDANFEVPPIAEKMRAADTIDSVDASTAKVLLASLADAERRNRQLSEELARVVKERDAALGLLLQAGQNQAELMQLQKKRRREADLKHASQIRALKSAIQEKTFSLEALRQQIARQSAGGEMMRLGRGGRSKHTH